LRRAHHLSASTIAMVGTLRFAHPAVLKAQPMTRP
jgi:hypothetical protein